MAAHLIILPVSPSLCQRKYRDKDKLLAMNNNCPRLVQTSVWCLLRREMIVFLKSSEVFIVKMILHLDFEWAMIQVKGVLETIQRQKNMKHSWGMFARLF